MKKVKNISEIDFSSLDGRAEIYTEELEKKINYFQNSLPKKDKWKNFMHKESVENADEKYLTDEKFSKMVEVRKAVHNYKVAVENFLKHPSLEGLENCHKLSRTAYNLCYSTAPVAGKKSIFKTSEVKDALWKFKDAIESYQENLNNVYGKELDISPRKKS